MVGRYLRPWYHTMVYSFRPTTTTHEMVDPHHQVRMGQMVDTHTKCLVRDVSEHRYITRNKTRDLLEVFLLFLQWDMFPNVIHIISVPLVQHIIVAVHDS